MAPYFPAAIHSKVMGGILFPCSLRCKTFDQKKKIMENNIVLLNSFKPDLELKDKGCFQGWFHECVTFIVSYTIIRKDPR